MKEELFEGESVEWLIILLFVGLGYIAYVVYEIMKKQRSIQEYLEGGGGITLVLRSDNDAAIGHDL
ncbi:MAG: hypothetical protein OWS74_04350 [Firmicutes bacterium]|nr:hypothetical protein [Bacillota bacterium]